MYIYRNITLPFLIVGGDDLESFVIVLLCLSDGYIPRHRDREAVLNAIYARTKAWSYSPWVSTKSGVVQSVESVVVREGDVCGVVQQQSQDVIPFLRDRIVKGCVTFRVLETKEQGVFS